MKKYLFLITTVITILLFQSCNKESNSVNKTFSAATPKQIIAGLSLDSGLYCYLKFNNNFNDASGHNNNGTLQGDNVEQSQKLRFLADRFGNRFSAIEFRKSNAWIEIPEKDFDGLTTMSISMDFFLTKNTGTQTLISKMSDSIKQFHPHFYQSFGLGFVKAAIGFTMEQEGNCDGSNTSGYDVINGSVNAADLTWDNIVITIDNNIEKMYLNGSLIGSLTKARTPVCSGQPIRLGKWWSEDTRYFTGRMDEVRIYNRVLSVGEITKLSAL